MKSAKEQQSPDKSTIDEADARKILRSVPYDQGFHFATGTYTGESAINLFSFYEELRTIDLQSVKFHFQRRDFQKWIETTLGDPELALKIDKVPLGFDNEELRKELLKIVQERLTELQTASNIVSKQVTSDAGVVASGTQTKKFSAEELKQYSGQNGTRAYVLFEGRIYDVTDSGLWQGGNHLGSHQAGQDLTDDIKSAPHGDEVFSKVKQIGVANK